VGDERAETYLRLLAEREFRRVIRPPADRAGPPSGCGWSRRSPSRRTRSRWW